MECEPTNAVAMAAVTQTTAQLGSPVLCRMLGPVSSPVAAIGRWRHGPTVVSVAASDTIRLAVSLVDRPNARDPSQHSRERPARDSSLSVFPAGESAQVEVTSEADIVQLFISQVSAEAMLHAPLRCESARRLHDDPLRRLMMRILIQSVEDGLDAAMRTEEMLSGVITRLSQHAQRPRSIGAPIARSFRGGLSPTAFARIQSMILTAVNEGTSVSLTQMARLARLSPAHFLRAFRQHTGVTPHRYLVRRRLDRAVSLLRQSDIAISDLADRVGYSSPAHFVAAFRAGMGVTPGVLRTALGVCR